MHFGRLHYFTLALLLVGALGTGSAQASPLAVVANFQEGFAPGTAAIVDTATDKLVGSPLHVGVNPTAVAITPDGKTAIVACAYSADLWFIDLTANPPAITGTLPVGSGAGNTFFPGGLAVSPDGQYVAVTALGVTEDPVTMQPLTPQTNLVKVVSLKDPSGKPAIEQELNISSLPDTGGGTLSAEASAFSNKGAIVLASADPAAPALVALSFAAGQINLPDAASNNGQLAGFGGPNSGQPVNVAITPDGSTAIVPAGRQFVHTFSIDATDQMTETSGGGISSGGDGAQSVAITADGKLAYVLNLLPPGNITQFQIQPGSTIKSTGLKLNSSPVPAVIAAIGGLPVGNQMIAVTPDGKKIYTVNPYAPGLTGELEVFTADKPDAIQHVNVGINPYAIAIQQQ
jgi:DNA-binding beta-propeller fold protein YncE